MDRDLHDPRIQSNDFQPGSEGLEATFELNDTLYAKAVIPPTDEVYLWLGANVMLSYPTAEAETLLESKLSAAQQSLANCEEDLDFLREQITVRTASTSLWTDDANTMARPWRLPPRGFTIGISCRRGEERWRAGMRVQRRVGQCRMDNMIICYCCHRIHPVIPSRDQIHL